MNYILIFLWVSFFSIVFWDPRRVGSSCCQPGESSGLWFLFCYAVFITCFVAFLFLTNLFRRKMEPSLFYMSCNLITLFFCGIVTSSMNNLTHYLHKKGPPLFDIGFFLIPEIPLQYAETSDCILVGYIMICVLRSLFLHPAVRNKMWADFGRISSIMILCKVHYFFHLESISGIYGMVDPSSRSCASLPTWFPQLRSQVNQKHLYQPRHHVRPRSELRRSDF